MFLQQSCRVGQGSPGPQEGRGKDSDVQRGGNDQAQEGWKVEVSSLSLAIFSCVFNFSLNKFKNFHTISRCVFKIEAISGSVIACML